MVEADDDISAESSQRNPILVFKTILSVFDCRLRIYLRSIETACLQLVDELSRRRCVFEHSVPVGLRTAVFWTIEFHLIIDGHHERTCYTCMIVAVHFCSDSSDMIHARVVCNEDKLRIIACHGFIFNDIPCVFYIMLITIVNRFDENFSSFDSMIRILCKIPCERDVFWIKDVNFNHIAMRTVIISSNSFY